MGQRSIKAAAVLAVMTLAACASTQNRRETSPPQTATIAGETRPVLVSGYIDTRIERGPFESTYTRYLTIAINGEMVAAGFLDPRSISGDVIGQWKNRNAAATCSSQRKTRDWIDVRCILIIDGQQIATLTF